MSKLTAIRIRYQDGTISSEKIPVGVFAENVNWTDEIALTDILGYEVVFENDGTTIRSIQKQIDEKIDQNELLEQIDNSLTKENAIAEAKAVGDELNNLQNSINNKIDKIDLKEYLEEIENLDVDTNFEQYLKDLSLDVIRDYVAQEVSEEYLENFISQNISFDKLLGGEIVLKQTQNYQTSIHSDNEKLLIDKNKINVFKNLNDNSYPIIKINYGNNNESYEFKNENGETVFNSSQGITENAIPDQLITNEKIKDETISKNKLNFIPAEVDQQGRIYNYLDISKITQDDNTKIFYDDDYYPFKSNTQSALNEVNSRLTTALEDIQNGFNGRIDNSATYTLYIDCPNGTNIHGQNIILTAHLFRNSVDVTDEFSDQYFTWTRQSSDYYGDIYWNDNHQTKTKTIIVTANDVKINADFRCVFEYEGTTVTSE